MNRILFVFIGLLLVLSSGCIRSGPTCHDEVYYEEECALEPYETTDCQQVPTTTSECSEEAILYALISPEGESNTYSSSMVCGMYDGEECVRRDFVCEAKIKNIDTVPGTWTIAFDVETNYGSYEEEIQRYIYPQSEATFSYVIENVPWEMTADCMIELQPPPTKEVCEDKLTYKTECEPVTDYREVCEDVEKTRRICE